MNSARHTIKKVSCPGCGKEIHCFHVPSKPGVYRLRCQSNREVPVNIRVRKDGSISRDRQGGKSSAGNTASNGET